MIKMRAAALAACGLAALNGGCATTTMQSPEARSVIDQAAAQCTATVLGGALLGAIVGNNNGNNGAGRGALAGAAAGGAVCAVIMAAAQNRAELIESQRQAVAAGTENRFEFTTEEGAQLVMNTTVEEAEPAAETAAEAASAPPVCRYANSTLEGPGAPRQALGRQKFCRTAAGTWELA